MRECRQKRRSQRMAGQARAALLWGLAFYAVAHVALLIATQRPRAKLRDPEFGYKLALLCQHRQAAADRPVLLLLGSSRTGLGFRPAVLPAFHTPDGRTPIVFNYSMVGSGPLAELVCLRRLLDADIRPDWLAIEILPPLLGRKIDACGNPDADVCRLTWRDVCLLLRYAPFPQALTRRWFEAQLAPWYAHRFAIMNHYAANCLPWRRRVDHWKILDDLGWSDLGADSDKPVKDPHALEVARQTYQDELQDFHIAPMQDQALRDLIALCRREDIPTVLYLTPEGSIFQSWYVPPTRACIEDYLSRLSRQCHIPIVDARNWIADDYFHDSHHLERRGATQFTRRFGADVIQHLVRGELDAIRSVLVPAGEIYPESQHEQTPLLEVRGRPVQPPSPALSINGGTPPAGSPGKSGRSRSIP